MEERMVNGYYLSTYIHIDETAHVLKLEVRHDQNIALWKYGDGVLELIHYWELERLSGIKHHSRSFYSIEDYEDVVNMLLEQHGLNIKKLVEIWDRPQIRKGENTHWYFQISYQNQLVL